MMSVLGVDIFWVVNASSFEKSCLQLLIPTGSGVRGEGGVSHRLSENSSYHSRTRSGSVGISHRLKEVHIFSVNIDRALTFGYDLHEHFMQLIPKFGKYLQYSLFFK